MLGGQPEAGAANHAVEIGSSFLRSACPPDVIENSTILRRHPCGDLGVTAGRGYVLAILLGLSAAGLVLWQLESSTSTECFRKSVEIASRHDEAVLERCESSSFDAVREELEERRRATAGGQFVPEGSSELEAKSALIVWMTLFAATARFRGGRRGAVDRHRQGVEPSLERRLGRPLRRDRGSRRAPLRAVPGRSQQAERLRRSPRATADLDPATRRPVDASCAHRPCLDLARPLDPARSRPP